jgi:hypothetical protein
MKRLLIGVTALLLVAGSLFGQYRQVTIRQIQEDALDSLKVADQLQNSQPIRYTLQASTLHLNRTTGAGDTVTVVGVVTVPQGVITYNNNGWTMMLSDTGTGAAAPWGSVFFRMNSAADSTDADLAGFRALTPGTLVKVTGVIGEFPTNYMNSLTQLNWLKGSAIIPLGKAALPKPVRLTVGDFYTGLFPGGSVRFSTGEKYEGCYVELVNLTVTARVNTSRGTFSMVDADGNEVSEYDISRYYTLGHGTPTIIDSTWLKIYPQVGTSVDTIRGYMWTASGGENTRGYRISPIYRSDVVLGAPVPLVSTHKRNPVFVTPNDTAGISVKVVRPYGGSSIASVRILYSVNNAAFAPISMTYKASDTTYVGTIPKQAVNSTVRYFIEAADSASRVARLANSAFGSFSLDTSKGFFFYDVLSRDMTIKDVQYTPYVNGRSPYLGGVVTVRGVVTADTASINLNASTSYQTTAWYIQSGNAPWSGIWVTASTDTTLKRVKLGDSIAVTGTVQEVTATGSGDVTRIGNVSTPVTILASGVTLPTPVVKTTAAFGANAANGSPTAEPWEGMLVRFNNVTVTDVYPNFSEPADYTVDDGSGPAYVRQDGKNTWSNVATDTALGKKILKVGDKISSLTGIMFYGFNHYKLVPRTNADFGTVTTTGVGPVKGSDVPNVYALDQNYPNPFNPSTRIQYGLPVAGLTTLKVYNLLGQEVATLVNEHQAPGTYTVKFDATSLASGMYFFRVQSGWFSAVKKMMLVK